MSNVKKRAITLYPRDVHILKLFTKYIFELQDFSLCCKNVQQLQNNTNAIILGMFPYFQNSHLCYLESANHILF